MYALRAYYRETCITIYYTRLRISQTANYAVPFVVRFQLKRKLYGFIMYSCSATRASMNTRDKPIDFVSNIVKTKNPCAVGGTYLYLHIIVHNSYEVIYCT